MPEEMTKSSSYIGESIKRARMGAYMTEDITANRARFDITSRSMFSNADDVFTSRSFSALVAKNTIPVSHKKCADNYVVVKKYFAFQAVNGRISATEKALLERYDFSPLEFTTVKQMFEELVLLQKWSLKGDEKLSRDADEIIEIRAKELRFLSASHYASLSNEIYRGYIALENYFTEISKYK